MMTLIHKIPPNLPLQREELPLFGKEGRGEIFRCPRQFNFETLNKIETWGHFMDYYPWAFLQYRIRTLKGS
jgi:hypothetical protein